MYIFFLNEQIGVLLCIDKIGNTTSDIQTLWPFPPQLTVTNSLRAVVAIFAEKRHKSVLDHLSQVLLTAVNIEHAY